MSKEPLLKRLMYVIPVPSLLRSCFLISVGLKILCATPRFRILPDCPSPHHPKRLLDEVTLLEPQSKMKALTGLLWVGAAFEVSTVAGEAFVYTSESWLRQSPADPPSMSPNTARLLFAQRLGLSQYHSLQDFDDSTLEILNVYGGNRQQIFTQKERSPDAEKLLLVVEGVDEGSSAYQRW